MLSRQQRRELCRKVAKAGLKSMPIQETRREHRKSVKLLAKRMFHDVPTGTFDEPTLASLGIVKPVNTVAEVFEERKIILP
jgi:hypothetical protein